MQNPDLFFPQTITTVSLMFSLTWHNWPFCLVNRNFRRHITLQYLLRCFCFNSILLHTLNSRAYYGTVEIFSHLSNFPLLHYIFKKKLVFLCFFPVYLADAQNYLNLFYLFLLQWISLLASLRWKKKGGSQDLNTCINA